MSLENSIKSASTLSSSQETCSKTDGKCAEKQILKASEPISVYDERFKGNFDVGKKKVSNPAPSSPATPVAEGNISHVDSKTESSEDAIKKEVSSTVSSEENKTDPTDDDKMNKLPAKSIPKKTETFTQKSKKFLNNIFKKFLSTVSWIRDVTIL